MYLQFFDRKYIRGSPDHIQIGYVVRSGGVQFVPLYGIEFLYTSKTMRYIVLAFASYLKDGKGHLNLQKYYVKFLRHLRADLEKLQDHEFDISYSAYAGFLLESIISEDMKGSFVYVNGLLACLWFLFNSGKQSEPPSLTKMWQIVLRLLHSQHFHHVRQLRPDELSHHYEEITGQLQGCLVDIDMWDEQTSHHQSLGPPSTFLQFYLEYFLFLNPYPGFTNPGVGRLIPTLQKILQAINVITGRNIEVRQILDRAMRTLETI